MTDPARPGRLAGIDYGTVRIGIAVSDARQTLASPYENYTRRSPQADAEYFEKSFHRILWFLNDPSTNSDVLVDRSVQKS